MAIASLRLALARRSGQFSEVIEQVNLLDASIADESSDPIAMGSELRGVALLNLGIVETWSGRLADAERHLSEGAALARTIGRPYLEVACRAHQGFPSKLVSVATARERGRQAVALAERHGLDDRPILAPALGAVGGMAIWMGEFDEGERWLRRAWEVAEPIVDPAPAVLLHVATGMLHAGRGEHRSALAAFAAAARAQSLLTGVHALAPRIAGWLATMQARLGRPDEARATLGGFSPAPERIGALGAIDNARAAIGIAEGDPAAALDALGDALVNTPRLGPAFTLVEAHLLAGIAHLSLGDRNAAAAAAEEALAAAEPDRLIFPFALTEAAELLDALPRHATAHGALLADIVDLLRGASAPSTDRERAVATRGAQPERAARPAISADEPDAARDRARALRLHQHGQHAHPQHLLQARRARSLFRRPTRTGAAAPRNRARLSIAEPRERRQAHDHRIPASPAHQVGLQDDRVATPPDLYTIRIRGRLGATALSAFPSMESELQGSETVLTGLLEDRSALFGVVAQIEALGLELLELRQIPARPASARQSPDASRRQRRRGRGRSAAHASSDCAVRPVRASANAVLAVVAVAQFMVVLDASVVNVALPSIQRDVGFSEQSLSWVLNAYTLIFGGFLLLGGRAADRLGRRRLFMAGIALFAGASLACGLSQSEATLLIARGAQGLGGAMVSPAALSIILTTFAEGSERNRALAVWGAIAGAGGAVGLLLGGVIVEVLSWRWVFFVNVPIGAAVLAAGAADPPREPGARAPAAATTSRARRPSRWARWPSSSR